MVAIVPQQWSCLKKRNERGRKKKERNEVIEKGKGGRERKEKDDHDDIDRMKPGILAQKLI